ncbi:hypothetical protein ASPVEDRAFT_894920 [Aspergillus versicolor CBS 583.65]|uniref:HNH nuclease domain-containing protein n=1 Tax=Aspergillus versicolor CBS 583.65 TaxID=1036611 RepID=A0A1L9PW45_ASPVE|nr:uncharacterized protein ASPVEDRAFT_894920 [Aspergillus versicolor CBS 583.65]OJJ05769.1 hypothetical protein ASPVEDRAFT_894920 [Aspergillus versicolor CBS 583.65]
MLCLPSSLSSLYCLFSLFSLFSSLHFLSALSSPLFPSSPRLHTFRCIMEISAFPELLDTNRMDILFDILDDIVPEDPFFWAFGAIADIDSLGSFFDMAPEEQNDISDITIWTRVLKIWITSAQLNCGCDRAEIRDRNTCVLTGKSDNTVQAARICRFETGVTYVGLEDSAMDSFWDRLRTLFTDRRVRRWKRAFERAEGCFGAPKNMVCLSEPARALWKLGRFALRPVQSPVPPKRRRSLMVEFHWIGLRSDAVTPLVNKRTGEYIRSGDTFTIRTDDPVCFPLPSVELLNMQWVLTRVVGFARASLGDRAAFLLNTIDYGPVEEIEDGIIEDEVDPEAAVGLYNAEVNFAHFESYSASIGGPSFDYGDD